MPSRASRQTRQSSRRPAPMPTHPRWNPTRSCFSSGIFTASCRTRRRDTGLRSLVVLVWLADAIVALPLAYLAFIPLGGVLAIRWPRLILPHLAAVAIGLISVTVKFDCPLTTWE